MKYLRKINESKLDDVASLIDLIDDISDKINGHSSIRLVYRGVSYKVSDLKNIPSVDHIYFTIKRTVENPYITRKGRRVRKNFHELSREMESELKRFGIRLNVSRSLGYGNEYKLDRNSPIYSRIFELCEIDCDINCEIYLQPINPELELESTNHVLSTHINFKLY